MARSTLRTLTAADARRLAIARQHLDSADQPITGQAEKLAQAKEMAAINKEFVGSGEPVPFTAEEVRDQAGFANTGADLPPLPDIDEEDAE